LHSIRGVDAKAVALASYFAVVVRAVEALGSRNGRPVRIS
jgi:hypothetical protein